ncbi:MAG: SoxR reducing system RseC family protein [Nitrospirae bacterium]|nr:SoxR reducing system RseC family protein [Nitrospirota bacterium]
MEENGIIKEIVGANAIVVVQRKSGCDSCPGGSFCKTIDGGAEVEAVNMVRAGVGDTVIIAFKTQAYLKAVVLVYGIPSLMLIIGAVIGKEYLSRLFPLADADILSAIAGFGLFIISLAAAKISMRGLSGKKDNMPVIKGILKEH